MSIQVIFEKVIRNIQIYTYLFSLYCILSPVHQCTIRYKFHKAVDTIAHIVIVKFHNLIIANTNHAMSKFLHSARADIRLPVVSVIYYYAWLDIAFCKLCFFFIINTHILSAVLNTHSGNSSIMYSTCRNAWTQLQIIRSSYKLR